MRITEIIKYDSHSQVLWEADLYINEGNIKLGFGVRIGVCLIDYCVF